MSVYEKTRGGGRIWLTRRARKRVYPERPSGAKDLSSHATTEGSDPVGKRVYPERPSGARDLSSHATTEGSDPVGKRVYPERPSASSTHTPLSAARASNSPSQAAAQK